MSSARYCHWILTKFGVPRHISIKVPPSTIKFHGHKSRRSRAGTCGKADRKRTDWTQPLSAFRDNADASKNESKSRAVTTDTPHVGRSILLRKLERGAAFHLVLSVLLRARTESASERPSVTATEACDFRRESAPLTIAAVRTCVFTVRGQIPLRFSC
jgi:hypothetical protein